ncbi:MAG: hypothetical protein OXG84_15080 [Chloroflexi bacterium]|nr:hypothetical protein [Chloroflexota bacterium]
MISASFQFDAIALRPLSNRWRALAACGNLCVALMERGHVRPVSYHTFKLLNCSSPSSRLGEYFMLRKIVALVLLLTLFSAFATVQAQK